MSGLKNTAKRLWNLGNPFQEGGYATGAEVSAKKAADRQAALDRTFAGAAMPDEELVRRNERRKAAARRGSRQRNVLTDEDSLG